jgi:hypothetical protein
MTGYRHHALIGMYQTFTWHSLKDSSHLAFRLQVRDVRRSLGIVKLVESTGLLWPVYAAGSARPPAVFGANRIGK